VIGTFSSKKLFSFLKMDCLEFLRGLIAQRAVKALVIVEGKRRTGQISGESEGERGLSLIHI